MEQVQITHSESTYWYKAMVSLVLWDKYTVKSSSLEIKQNYINKPCDQTSHF